MRATIFETFGDPSILKMAEVPAPTVVEKAALVRLLAASINPSDVKNVVIGAHSPAGRKRHHKLGHL